MTSSTTRKRVRPFKAGIRWINNPDNIYYWKFNSVHRIKKVLGSTKYAGKFEWAAIYHYGEEIETFTYEKGWQRKAAAE